MNDLKLLLKMEWKRFVYSLKQQSVKLGKGKGKGKSTAMTIVLAVTGVMMFFYAILYFSIMADQFTKLGIPELLIGLVMAACSVMVLFTTIYKIKGILFGFNDYDFVMSLPIKTSLIVASKVIVLYSLNFFFCLFLLVPAAGVYAWFARPGASFYIHWLLTVVFVPMIPVVAAAVIGTLIHYAASFFKYKNAVNMIITLTFFTAVMYSSFNMNRFILNAGEIGKSLMAAVNRLYPFARLYTNAVCEADYGALLVFIAVSLAVFILFCFTAGALFRSLNTVMAAVKTSSNFKMKALSQSPPLMALYKRELKRYFSSVNYVLNTGIGVILFTMAVVALAVKGVDALGQFMEMPGLTESIGVIGPVAISFFVVMTDSAACSISLEGRSLWIVKSLPIGARDVFLSKLFVNLTLTVPATLLNVTILVFILKPSVLQTVFFYLVPLSYAFFTAVFGLAINLAFPNFNWTNEITVIKQSAAMLIAVFGGMGSIAVPIIAIVATHFEYAVPITAATVFVVVTATAVMYRNIMTKGVKTFEAF